MPISYFRTFEGAARALWVAPGDPAILRKMAAVWSVAQPLLAAAPAPRGIRRFHTIEESQADRDRSDEARIRALQSHRQGR